MRGIKGFVLAAQNFRNFAGQATHHLIFCIDEIPLADNIFSLRMETVCMLYTPALHRCQSR